MIEMEMCQTLEVHFYCLNVEPKKILFICE